MRVSPASRWPVRASSTSGRRRSPGAGRTGPDIVTAGRHTARPTRSAGQSINLEFVSANPTGLVDLGGAGGRPSVTRSAGSSRRPGARRRPGVLLQRPRCPDRPLQLVPLASARGRQAPEDGYGGEYIHEIARSVVEQRPGCLDLDDAAAQEVFRQVGVEMMFTEIKQSLHDFKVDFDVYFHEDDLHRSGAVGRAVERLAALGNTYEKDGATWLATERFGDDKDRVVQVRRPGRLPLRRPRLLPRQARARLRPLLHHAGRRPPRLCRPDDGDVRGVRRRAARQPRDPDRPDGQPAPRRPAAADVQAGRHRRHHRRPGGGDRRRRGALRAGPLQQRQPHRHRPRPVGARAPTTTPSSPSSTPTPGSRA